MDQENVHEEDHCRIGLEIAAIERAMQRAQSALAKQRAALRPDAFGRVFAHMPLALRTAYENGTWKNSKVYMWTMVLQHAKEGHALAKEAENGLLHISHRPAVGRSAHPQRELVEHSKAVADAVAVASRIGKNVRAVLIARKQKRNAKLRALTREYMQKRKEWSSQLARYEAEKTPAVREALLENDRRLLVATRATTGMGGNTSPKDTTQMFLEIEQAGGTAGGLERWSRSITAIPDQNVDCLPATSDGGGVLIEDPLEEHYRARTINPWTRTERLLFLEKYLIHGKNFRKIATFFEYKSVEDVVRFYFDHKLPLKLKLLAKDSAQKRRAIKKNNLVELSKLPVESRSIRDNFIHQRVTALEEPADIDLASQDAEMTDAHPAGRGWTAREEQMLVTALCCIDVAGGNTSANMTLWTKVSGVVETKTPIQCRQFYDQYKKVRGLEQYSPPKGEPLVPVKRNNTSEPRTGNSARKQARLMSMDTASAAPLVVQQRTSSSVAM